MRIHSFLTFSHLSLLFAIILTLYVPLTSWSQHSTHTWEVFEMVLESQNTSQNPYMDISTDSLATHFSVTFTGTEGEAQGKELTVPGFWDGRNTWKARFAPPNPGKWHYKTVSMDHSLNGHTGEIKVEAWDENAKKENPTRRGFIQINQESERAGRYFVYADGTPFLWIGDTWWNWTKRGIHLDSFKKLADDRNAKGFTIGQLFFAGRGWGRSSSLLDETYSQPNIEHIHAVEEMIRYANEKGITVWIHGWWGSNSIDKTIGAENIRRWWRYIVHRLSAYNVIWVLAGEYNLYNYGDLGLDFWNDLGVMIQNEDPYVRAVSIHPTPPAWGGGNDAPQWSTADVLHSQSWLDYNQCQVGHSRWRNELIPFIVKDSYRRTPAKPIVVTEPWYEFVQGNPTGEEIRFGAWSAILSGAAGHTYGGGHVWKAHVPEAPAGKDSWPMEMSFDVNTLDYPGSLSIGFLSQILHEMEWWKLEPHPEYVIENPSPHCAADPGKTYLAFLRWGGHTKIDLSAAQTGSTFSYRWIDLANQRVVRDGKTQGGEIRDFSPPEDYPGVMDYKDWLLHIRIEE